MAVPVYERQEALKPLPGVRASAPGGADAYGAGVGKALGGLAEAGLRMAEDLEDAHTLELYNNFKRDVSRYHSDPDKGVLNRVGKNAIGLYSEAETWMNNKAEEYARKMKSPRAVQNFRGMAGQTITGQGEQNSVYEAKQIRAYREADAGIQMAFDDAVRNWRDDAVFDASIEAATGFFELKSRGLGDDARKAGLAEQDSRFAAGRLSAMIEADPAKAEAWYKEHKEMFTGAAQVEVEAALEKETKEYKTQAAVDELARKFGPGNAGKGLAWIRQNYSGEEENAIAAAFKVRVAEMDADRAHREAQKNKWQERNFETLYKEYTAQGVNPPKKLIDEMLFDGRLSPGRHNQIDNWILAAGARAGAEKLLQKRMGADKWASLSVDDRERALMREQNVTKEERADILKALAVGSIDGSMPDSVIDGLYKEGKITAAENAYYKGLSNKFSAEQKAFSRRRKAEIRNDVGKIFGMELEGAPNAARDAEAIFAEKIADLDETSKTYREDVLKAKKEAIAEAIENSVHKLTRNVYVGIGGSRTPFGIRNDKILGAIDNAIADVEEYRPEVYDSLTGEKKPTGNAKDERKAQEDATWDESGFDDEATDPLSDDIRADGAR